MRASSRSSLSSLMSFPPVLTCRPDEVFLEAASTSSAGHDAADRAVRHPRDALPVSLLETAGRRQGGFQPKPHVQTPTSTALSPRRAGRSSRRGRRDTTTGHALDLAAI